MTMCGRRGRRRLIGERGMDRWEARLLRVLRRSVAVVLVFHYVCLAWVFFRAASFDAAFDDKLMAFPLPPIAEPVAPEVRL